MLHERIYLDNSDELAYVDTYVSDLPHGGPRDAMIVFPGGGYVNVCADREGEAIAEACAAHGTDADKLIADINAFLEAKAGK